MNTADELRRLSAALRKLPHDRPGAALVTLVRTQGAAFRRIGTRMLVHADGHATCELAGGCPQRDLVLQACEAIACGGPRLVRYGEEGGLDLLMEMGCGGELEVHIEPLAHARARLHADILDACLQRRQAGWLVTVFARDGEAVPARHWLRFDGDEVRDDLDVPGLSDAVGQAVHGRPDRPACTQVDTASGRHDLLIEPVQPPHALVVIGSGAVARALLPLADALGWSITVVDHDGDRLAAMPMVPGCRRVHAAPEALASHVPLDRWTSVVVMTHHLAKDIDYLAALRDRPLAYVGLLGARGRVAKVIAGAAAQAMAVHAPVGLDLGADGPAEIALAIVAEILAVVRQRAGGPLGAVAGSGS
ncbi:MAG: XdhC family protein [Xanthomonadaceae bacterium]|nr:XdhC family protein [Xanthomonadaceae bacterium]MDE1964721.1 XdhC family protein [Xanthomonadaceae bacterium]